MATLSDIISTFTQSDLKLTVPLDLQDVSESDMTTVNEYNALLSSGDYASATTYRNEHSELEKYILDVKKYNMLQTFVMNAYLYAKDQKQQCQISDTEPEGQVEGDIWLKVTGEKDDITMSVPYQKQEDGTYKEFSVTKTLEAGNVTYDGANGVTEATTTQEAIDILADQIMSFEETKSNIVSSSLGQSLSLTEDIKWDELVDAVTSSYCGKISTSTIADYSFPAGYYEAFTANLQTAYNQGKNDALKVSGGIQVYPNTNNITSWSGSTSVSATGADKAAVTKSASGLTASKVDLTDATYINVTFSGSANPTSNGSGSKNELGYCSATAYVSSNGSTSVKSGSVSWSASSGSKVVTLDVSSLSGTYFIHASMTAKGGYITNTKPRYWYSTSSVSLSSIKAGK